MSFQDTEKVRIELKEGEWRKVDLSSERNRIKFGSRIKMVFVPVKNFFLKISDKYNSSNASKTWLRPIVIRFAATAAAAVLLCAGINSTDYRLGYEVLIDGETAGLVTNQNIVYEAIDSVKNKVEEMGNGRSYEKEPVFIRRVVSEKDSITVEDLSAKLLNNVGYLVNCYSIDINGVPLFGVATEEAANWVLNKYKTKFITGEITDDTLVEFCEDVKINENYLNIAMLKTPEEAIAYLGGNAKETSVYITKENDTVWQIARDHDTTVEKIFALNDGLTELIHEGMPINVEETVPLLSVKSTQTLEFIEDIPYEVKKIEDSNIYKDVVEVENEGKSGQAKVLAKVTKINNTEIEKDVLSTETIVAPIAKVERVGTKERPSTTGSGSFIKPAYGSLSSRYGTRWGRSHNGIDIAGSYNSPIVAADGGRVTYAGWMNGYGNYVIIDHENGYQTAYGHCASLCVSVGQRVSKGEHIANMGSTGRSTGTHLHFEVKVNSKFTDPLGYVSY